MNISNEHYLEIYNAGFKCQQTYVKQDHASLESSINSLIDTCELYTSKMPYLGYLISNTSDSRHNYLTNLIIKQNFTSQLLCEHLSFQTNSCQSIVRASLYILFSITKRLIAAKKQKNKSTLQQLQTSLNKACVHAFHLAMKLKIQDQECLKLLSQLARKNKYSNTNQVQQVTVLTSININLDANLGLFAEKKCLNNALANQFIGNNYGQIRNPFFSTYSNEFEPIIHHRLYSGCIIHNSIKQRFLVLDVSTDESNLRCIPLDNMDNSVTVEIACNTIKRVSPQPNIALKTLLTKLQHIELNIKPTHFTNKHKQNLALKYEAPANWRTIAGALSKQLINKLDKYEEHKQTILSVASQTNREKIKVNSLKHAVSILGTDRLLPIVTTSVIRTKQRQHRFNGSDMVENKINLFVDLVSKTTKPNNKLMPEHMSVIARVLFLAFVTIPKASFAVSMHQPKTINNAHTNKTHLANIYGLKNTANWKKLSLKLAASYLLPKRQQHLILAYFNSLEINGSPQKTASNNFLKEIKIIDDASLEFAQLISNNQQLPEIKNYVKFQILSPLS